MKTVAEKVYGMSRHELEIAARSHYGKMIFELGNEIIEKRRHPERAVTLYYIDREILMGKDLFDPRYDDILQKAVTQKSTVEEIAGEVNKIRNENR